MARLETYRISRSARDLLLPTEVVLMSASFSDLIGLHGTMAVSRVCRFEASSTRPPGIRTPGFVHSAWDVTIDAVARRPNERIDPAVQGTT
jgi:hypothetical protein